MDDDDEYNNIEMQGAFKDIERTSKRDVNIDLYIDMIGSKRSKLFRSDIEIFITDIVRITKELIDINVLNTNDQDIILDTISKLDKPEYKNATAYILGYIISQGGNKLSIDFYYLTLTLLGKNIKDEKIKKITNDSIKNKIYSIKRNKFKVDDKSVESPDIIRYGRLWMNI